MGASAAVAFHDLKMIGSSAHRSADAKVAANHLLFMSMLL
jgi:hypothetical protein